VVFLTWPKAPKNDIVPSGIYGFPSPRPTHLVDLRFALNRIKRERADAILANFGSVNILMLAGWLTKVPVRIAWYHTLNEPIRLDGKKPAWQESLLEFRKRLFYRLCTHFVSVSRAGVKDLANIFHVPSARVQVLHNSMPDPKPGIDSSPVREAQTLVCVGRFDVCKGQDVLIKAISLLHNQYPDLVVKFIGDGGMMTKCQGLARELEVEEHCQFLGSLPNQEVLYQLAQASASVLPSRNDNLPSTVIEALAVGTPVIASRVGGIPEMFHDGKEGFLVPREDPVALANCIARLLREDELRRQMGEESRCRFLEAFESSKVVPRQADWLESVVC